MSTAALSPEVMLQFLATLTPEQRRALASGAAFPEDSQAGAPADFGGQVFANPEGRGVHDDTDSGIPVTRLPMGVALSRQNFSGPMPGDVSNPDAVQILPGAMRTVGTQMDATSPESAWTPVAETPAGWTPVEETKTPQQSSASRLGSNFLSGLGVTTDEQAKNFFRHPIDTLLGSLNAQGELAAKAKEAAKRGDYKSAVIHGLNYLLPFIGQQTDQAGQQLSEGDIAGGVGRTLGAATPIVLGSPEARALPGKALSAGAKAAGVVGDTFDPDLVGIASPRAANALRVAQKVGKVARKVGSEPVNVLDQPASEYFRDATLNRRNIPDYAGEEIPEAEPTGAPIERDATRQNEPYAGENFDLSAPATSLAEPRQMVGSAQGAISDTANIAQAKRELGPGASDSAVILRAQELKTQATPLSLDSPASEVMDRTASELNKKPPQSVGPEDATDSRAGLPRPQFKEITPGMIRRALAELAKESPKNFTAKSSIPETAPEGTVLPLPDQDLTDLLLQSLERVRKRKAQ